MLKKSGKISLPHVKILPPRNAIWLLKRCPVFIAKLEIGNEKINDYMTSKPITRE